ncbi:hypothetical protein GCM10011375_18870 [Hymenobacter qilianensis]|uniref:Uncharacterized protein n=2 Tax=Hymenobacter qilianensis TaxID=1385715 RepID=A0A7H0GUU6_9BACT|nr:hypothetical protein [Hymenobacter qilianensis]QNP52062.1 hypothetical protein H9L05_19550 [Hymenobacter qilianensis]GGF64204.1 hypothetical protein GCM10011375_18870 [Hymenobacter qilianensis]
MQKLVRVLLWLVILLLGADLVLFFLQSDFKIARELNPVDLLTALLTLFLAVYIPTRLERRLSSKRYELEVLIRGTERLQAEFSTIRNQVVAVQGLMTTEQAAAIVQGFTNASHGIKTLTELSKLCERPDLEAPLAQLEVRRRSFKRLVTGGGFQRDPAFQYSSTQLAAIDGKYYDNDLTLSKLIIRINRAL